MSPNIPLRVRTDSHIQNITLGADRYLERGVVNFYLIFFVSRVLCLGCSVFRTDRKANLAGAYCKRYNCSTRIATTSGGYSHTLMKFFDCNMG